MGYNHIRHCVGDGNCYYRAVYYAYLETLISKGEKVMNIFIEMLKNRKYNQLKKIDKEKMFQIIIDVCEQLNAKLIMEGEKKAFQHLFQSVILIPEFDLVFF